MIRALARCSSFTRSVRFVAFSSKSGAPTSGAKPTEARQEADPGHVDPEVMRLRLEAMAREFKSQGNLNEPIKKFMRGLSTSERRLLAREVRSDDLDEEPSLAADATESRTEESGNTSENPTPADEEDELERKVIRELSKAEKLLQALGTPDTSEKALVDALEKGDADSLPLNAEFWRSFPAAAPSLQRPRGAERSTSPPTLSKAAQRRLRAQARRELLEEEAASLLRGGAAARSALGPRVRYDPDDPAGPLGVGQHPSHEQLFSVTAEAAPDGAGGVRPSRAAAGPSRPPPPAAPSSGASAQTGRRAAAAGPATPFYAACAALGIDPYAVTPEALGIRWTPPGGAGGGSGAERDARVAAEAAEAWEDALAAVDMEEEGGALPAHCPRTGALLTDRQRRGFALARAALSYFPIADASFPWERLSGRGLSVEGVLQAAGLGAEDSELLDDDDEEEDEEGGRGKRDPGSDRKARDAGDESIRARIRATLLAEAGRRHPGSGRGGDPRG